MNIDEVLERVRAGERRAFSEIVLRYQGPLFAYLGRMGCSGAQAEELAQETFLRAWVQFDAFDARRGAFSTWLFTIARNQALNEFARADRQPVAAPSVPDDRACDAPQPPDRIATEERRIRLRAALMQLPVADRCVLALAYLEELSMADIARIERCSVGAVKVRLHRARRRLAGIMGDGDE